MSVSLVTWIERLQGDVPAHDGVPSSEQCQQAIMEAVTDFNTRATRQKVATIQIKSGQATYDLPPDFWKYIRLTWRTAKDVIISPDGLIPLSPFQPADHHTISGLTISFYPTPQYTVPRDLWYGAGHVLNGDIDNPAYAEMLPQEQGIIHLLAQSKALMLQANAAARQAWSYNLGSEGVNKTTLADKLRDQAKELKGDYEEKVKRIVGMVSSTARYEIY
jgi:hypothetical protein